MLTTTEKFWRKIMIRCFRLFVFDYLSQQKIHPRVESEKIGTDYGGWFAPTALLSADSTIYCAGCGEDISFDLGLIDILNCKVHGFDPTPRAIEYVQENTKGHPNYFFHPIGIWDEADTLEFFVPADSSHVSHSLLNLQNTDSAIQVKVNSIANIMKKLKHETLDLLKLDIEGAEYKVVESLINDQIHPKIICVEYDEFFNPLDRNYKNRIRKSISSLISNGYTLVHTQFNGNYTFVHNVS